MLVTARDLGRVLPSAWQQRVKMGARQPYRKFLGSVRREDGDQKFWRYQDVPGILDVWSAGSPARVHVVVVPAPGARATSSGCVRRRSLGFDVAGLDAEGDGVGLASTSPARTALRPNDSLGSSRPSCCDGSTTPSPATSLAGLLRRVKGSFVPTALVRSAPRDSFALPDNHVAWIEEAGATVVAALRSSSYDVVGDLDDLLPVLAADGRTPTRSSEAELLAAATTVLARLDLTARHSLDEALDALGRLLSAG